MRKLVDARLEEIKIEATNLTAEIEEEKEKERNRRPGFLKKVSIVNALNVELEALELLVERDDAASVGAHEVLK